MANLFRRAGQSTPIYKTTCPVFCNGFSDCPSQWLASGINASGSTIGDFTEVQAGDDLDNVGATKTMTMSTGITTGDPIGDVSVASADTCDDPSIYVPLTSNAAYAWVSDEPFIRYDQPWFIKLCGRANPNNGGSNMTAGTWNGSHGGTFSPDDCSGSAVVSILNASTAGFSRVSLGIGSSGVGAGPVCGPLPGLFPAIVQIQSNSCYCVTFSVDPCGHSYCVTVELRSDSFIRWEDPDNPGTFFEMFDTGDTFWFTDDGTDMTWQDNAGGTTRTDTSTINFPALLQSWNEDQVFALSFSANTQELWSELEVGDSYVCTAP